MGGETPVPGTCMCGVMRTDDWSQGPSPYHIADAAVQCVFELMPTALPPRRACVDMITCLDGPL